MNVAARTRATARRRAQTNPPTTTSGLYEQLYPTSQSFSAFTTNGGGFDGSNESTGQPTSGYFQVQPTPGSSQLPFVLPWSYKQTIDVNAVASYDVGSTNNQRANVYAFPSGSADGSDSRSHAYEGAEAWYRDFVYLDSNFQPNPSTSFYWLIEMHNWPDGPCCAHFGVCCDTGSESPGTAGTERLALRLLAGGAPGNGVDQLPGQNANIDPTPSGFRKSWHNLATPLQRQHWYDIVLHVKWSYLAANGLVEVWCDGVQKVSLTGIPTLYYYGIDNNSSIAGNTPGPSRGYFMLSNYRASGPQTAQSTVWHTGTMIGPTRASIGF